MIEAARDHRDGLRSGAGAIKESDISIASGVVAFNVEQLLDNRRATCRTKSIASAFWYAIALALSGACR